MSNQPNNPNYYQLQQYLSRIVNGNGVHPSNQIQQQSPTQLLMSVTHQQPSQQTFSPQQAFNNNMPNNAPTMPNNNNANQSSPTNLPPLTTKELEQLHLLRQLLVRENEKMQQKQQSATISTAAHQSGLYGNRLSTNSNLSRTSSNGSIGHHTPTIGLNTSSDTQTPSSSTVSASSTPSGLSFGNGMDSMQQQHQGYQGVSPSNYNFNGGFYPSPNNNNQQSIPSHSPSNFTSPLTTNSTSSNSTTGSGNGMFNQGSTAAILMNNSSSFTPTSSSTNNSTGSTQSASNAPMIGNLVITNKVMTAKKKEEDKLQEILGTILERQRNNHQLINPLGSDNPFGQLLPLYEQALKYGQLDVPLQVQNQLMSEFMTQKQPSGQQDQPYGNEHASVPTLAPSSSFSSFTAGHFPEDSLMFFNSSLEDFLFTGQEGGAPQYQENNQGLFPFYEN